MKHLTKFERELLADKHRSRAAEDAELLAQGLRICRNLSCASQGVPQPIELFYKVKIHARGESRARSWDPDRDRYDYYCFECRRYATERHRLNEPKSDREQRRRYNAHRRALRRQGALTRAENKVYASEMCQTHPWMRAEDCEIDACGLRKRDKRMGRRDAYVRAKIAAAMRGRRNNPRGRNGKRPKVWGFAARAAMRKAALRRWAAERLKPRRRGK